MSQRESVRASFWLLVVTVMVVAANLRTTVQGIGPLIDQIAGDTGLTPTALGLLGALPLLMYAIVSPVAHSISHRFGTNRTVLVSLVVLLIATVLRSVDAGLVPLWAGTMLTGAAIAVANVLMPAVIKHWFPDRLHAIMPVYTAVLAGTGALASGLVVPISHIQFVTGEAGWRFALLATGVLIVPGIIMWVIAVRRAGPERIAGEEPETRRKGIWRDRVAWLVALYMGFQGAAFYMIVTWLSPLSISYGQGEVQAGVEVMVMQLFSLGGSLTVPFLLRGWGRRWVPALIPIPGLVGLIGLMIWPAAWLWGPIFGYASGAMFAISMWLMADRARNRTDATSLSGMSQSAGYLICGIGPIAFAALHTLTGGWVASLCLAAVCMVGLVIVGIALRDHRYALEPRESAAGSAAEAARD